jgi:hypothetical protein
LSGAAPCRAMATTERKSQAVVVERTCAPRALVYARHADRRRQRVCQDQVPQRRQGLLARGNLGAGACACACVSVHACVCVHQPFIHPSTTHPRCCAIPNDLKFQTHLSPRRPFIIHPRCCASSPTTRPSSSTTRSTRPWSPCPRTSTTRSARCGWLAWMGGLRSAWGLRSACSAG